MGSFSQNMKKIHRGGLHESLHIAAGKPIPKSKIASAAAHGHGLLKKQAILAQTFAKMRHKKGK